MKKIWRFLAKVALGLRRSKKKLFSLMIGILIIQFLLIIFMFFTMVGMQKNIAENKKESLSRLNQIYGKVYLLERNLRNK